MTIADITQIPAPRVPFIDERTKLISREWYRWFINIFNLTGAGQSDATIIDLLITPPNTTNQEAKFAESEKQLQSLEMKAVMWESYIAESEKQLQSLEMKAVMWESYITESEKQLQSLMLSPYKEDVDFDLAAVVNAADSKTTPVDADELPLVDSASGFVLKKLTWANLKSAIKTYLSGSSFPIGGTTPATGVFTSLISVDALPTVTTNGTSGSGFRGYRIAVSGTEIATFFSDPSSGELRITSGFGGFGGYQTFYVNGIEGMRLDVSGNLSNNGSHTIGTFTVATRPPHSAGKLIYVSDGGAGANFQGSTGAAWVNLG